MVTFMVINSGREVFFVETRNLAKTLLRLNVQCGTNQLYTLTAHSLI